MIKRFGKSILLLTCLTLLLMSNAVYAGSLKTDMFYSRFPDDLSYLTYYDKTFEEVKKNENVSFIHVTKAVPTSSKVLVNEKEISFDAYLIEGNNYFKLRDIATTLKGTERKFEVSFDEDKKAINLTSNKSYTTVGGEMSKGDGKVKTPLLNTSILYKDGVELKLTAYTINGNNYFKLRDIGEAFDFGVFWDENTKTIKIDTTTSYMSDEQKSSLNPSNNSVKEPNYIYKVTAPFGEDQKNYDNRDSKFEIRNWNWVGEKKSYLIDNGDKTFQVVDAYSNDNIIILTYDLNFNLLNTNKIKIELDKFGAFYKGEDGYYILFGQDNFEENNNKEVYRVVKYSFDFKRIGATSVNGGESYTIEPFRAGTPRMVQKGNNLIVHTSRTRYLTEDGLNHQSNMTIKINTHSMKTTYISDQFPKNYAGHSFNQFVLFDGNIPVYVDHSDAYPSRAIILTKEAPKDYYDRANLMYIKGEVGENFTGTSLGGFEISSNKYLVAGNSIMQDENYLNYKIRNIFIATVPRDEVANYNTELTWITHYSESGDTNVYEPKLVKVNDKSFIILWQEYEEKEGLGWDDQYENSIVKYVYLDENGHPVSEIKILGQGVLPHCDPILIEDSLIWYTVNGDKMYFYKLLLGETASEDTTKPVVNKASVKKENKIIAGTLYTMVLKEDGTLWAAGDNKYGQLGDGTKKDSNIPVKVKGIDNIVGASAGENEVAAIKSDGTIWTWGMRSNSSIPVQVKGLSKIVQVSTSNSHTVALKEDGTIWSWGQNIYGQLGDRTNNESDTPIQAKGIDNVKKVVAGNSYTMILKNDGTVWAWGSNHFGELGDGTNVDKDLLIKVKELENITDIASGGLYSIALKGDGTVWTWGSNILGVLGNGTEDDSNIPVQVKGLSNIKAISASSGQSAALDKEGNVWTWGLMTGRPREDSLKPMIVEELGKVTEISIGDNIIMAVKEDNTIWAMGNNYSGQYGIGNNEIYFEPVRVFTN